MLVENGLKLNEAMWADCQKRLGTSQARDEYGPLLDRFIEYSLNEKGTHVSHVAKRIRIALSAGRPLHAVRKSTSVSGRPEGIIYYSGRLDAAKHRLHGSSNV